MGMHDGDDQEEPGFAGVKDCVREDPNEPPADILLQHRPTGRRGLNALEGGLDRIQESFTQPRFAPLVEKGSIPQFRQRLRMEPHLHS